MERKKKNIIFFSISPLLVGRPVPRVNATRLTNSFSILFRVRVFFFCDFRNKRVSQRSCQQSDQVLCRNIIVFTEGKRAVFSGPLFVNTPFYRRRIRMLYYILP